MGERRLTAKQFKFIELYQGNGTEAARLAGYKGNDNVLGVTANELLRNPRIAAAVHKRQNKEISLLIADRKKRQEFWSKAMYDESEKLQDRLRASELLGKSEGDFIEKIQHSGQLSFAIDQEKRELLLSDDEKRKKLLAAAEAIAEVAGKEEKK